MVNDSAHHVSYGGEFEMTGKKPSSTSINFVKQFARVYSTTKGIDFSYLILN